MIWTASTGVKRAWLAGAVEKSCLDAVVERAGTVDVVWGCRVIGGRVYLVKNVSASGSVLYLLFRFRLLTRT